MRIWTIARKELLVTARDRKALLLNLAMPLVLILVLGLALSGLFGGSRSLEPVAVGLVDHDGGLIGMEFAEVLGTPELAALMQVVTGEEEDLRRQVERGTLKALFIIPAGASDSYMAGMRRGADREPVQIQVVEDPASPVAAGVARTVASGFASQLNATMVTSRAAAGVVLQESPAALGQLLAAMQQHDEAGHGAGSISQDRRPLQPREQVSNMAYYAVAMTVMFLLFGSFGGSRSFLEERTGHTLGRLLTTPANRLEVTAGKLLGTYLTVLGQFAILVLFTSLVYRVRWGHPAGVLVLGLAVVLAATGLSTMVAALSRSERQADILMQFIIIPMTVLGGGFLPLYAMGDGMRVLSRLSINGWATEGFMQLMSGQGPLAILPAAGVLAAAGVLFTGIGAQRLKLQ